MSQSRCNESRRAIVMGGGAAAALSAFPIALDCFGQTAEKDPIQDVYAPRSKFALLIGNRDYPNRKDIAPAYKNVRDLKDILEYYEFRVSDFRDLDAAGMVRALADFGSQLRDAANSTLPGSVAAVFYFCGHGFQSQGRNYLVPAGVDPSSEKALTSSLRLDEDVLKALPQRYPGISIALIDACRTDPSIRRGVDDFNQIAAPEGMLVFFATRAGRPALAPISADRNTFFAGALVDVLRDANGVTPIDDLFRIAAVECQVRVKAEFDRAKLSISPQFPEESGNLRGRFVIRNRILELARGRHGKGGAQPTLDSSILDQRWQAILATLRPARLIRLCEQFEKDFPGSEYEQQVRVTIAGARQALESQRLAGLSADLFDDPVGNRDFRDEMIKALRGDKDAARRLSIAYRSGGLGVAQNIRRAEQWLRFSAELGSGIACWELSEVFAQSGQIVEAARYAKRARDLGYRPIALTDFMESIRSKDSL